MKFLSYLKSAAATALNAVLSIPSYLKVALATTLNIILNAATLGDYVWLEGGVCRGVFTNWA